VIKIRFFLSERGLLKDRFFDQEVEMMVARENCLLRFFCPLLFLDLERAKESKPRFLHASKPRNSGTEMFGKKRSGGGLNFDM